MGIGVLLGKDEELLRHTVRKRQLLLFLHVILFINFMRFCKLLFKKMKVDKDVKSRIKIEAQEKHSSPTMPLLYKID